MGILFDGIDDKIDTNGNLNDISTDWENDITIAWWQKYTRDGAVVRVMGSNNAGVNSLFQVLLDFEGGVGHNPGYITLSLRDEDGGGATVVGSSGSVLVEGQWQLIAVSRSGNTGFVYVDNVEVASGSLAAINNMATFTNDFLVGALNNVGAPLDYYLGDLDELAIWTQALSANERANLASSRIKYMPLQIQPANLKAYWPMDDEPDGTSADGDTLRDLSGNGNDGTGDDGANNTGLTWKAEEVLSYPVSVFPIIFTPTVVVGAIMNQFQGPNLGADLYNGALM